MVSERTLRLSLTWGLGSIATILIVILFVTGLMLKFTYQASPELAYHSIVVLIEQVPFGRLIRNMHRWSANGLLLVGFLHFLRVFYTRAFDQPRQFNWVIGLGLFSVIIISNFTGYLLPWDQIAYWAITISTSMLDYIPCIGTGLKQLILGGSEPGAATLLNFYAIHTAVLPLFLLFMIPFHFWRIRLANGLVIPRTPEESQPLEDRMLTAAPHLVTRDIALTMIVVALVLVSAMFFDAPLSSQANPGLSPNPTKAPWYFMGIQELLMHFHPVFALVVIPVLISSCLLLIPYFKEDAQTSGVWFGSHRGRKMTLVTLVFGLALTLAAVLLNEFVIHANESGPASLINDGLLPFLLIILVMALYSMGIKKLFSANRNELIQVLFTLTVTVFVVLTMIGHWLRGPGMNLTWVAG